jgi:hypothetical protein
MLEGLADEPVMLKVVMVGVGMMVWGGGGGLGCRKFVSFFVFSIPPLKLMCCCMRRGCWLVFARACVCVCV